MFSTLFKISDIGVPIEPFFWILAFFLGIFLFWRACKHELIESNLSFDLIIVVSVGALTFGRLVEFIVNWPRFAWSVKKLIFFNVWGGFDFWGAILGGIIATFVFLRSQKINPWHILDLAAAPVVFAQGVVAIGSFAKIPSNIVHFIYFALYFVLFFMLKRLAKRKRHPGFLVCFYLVGITLVDLLLFQTRSDVTYIGRYLPYQAAASSGILIFTLVVWHKLAGRKLVEDLKSVFALLLLCLMRFWRMLGDIEEAGKFSKTIILVPLVILKNLYLILKIATKEVFLGFVDFLDVLGVKKIR